MIRIFSKQHIALLSRLCISIFLTAFILLNIAYAYADNTASGTKQVYRSIPINASTANPTSNVPPISAKTAILIEQNSGKILYEKNADEKVFPASTTKILTALIALEQSERSDLVTVSDNATRAEGSSIYLKPGEKISMEDLLYGLMLRSGNDAAIAIAEHISGTTAAFSLLMNKRAAEIGAKNSNFITPNGLHDEQHYTTAYDMAMISRKAMQNPKFRTIVGAKNWAAEREIGEYSYFTNKNKVITQYEGGTGVKIGYTQAAGRTLVASAERDGFALICVVMNDPNWFDDSYKLMDWAYETYDCVQIAAAGDIITTIPLKGLFKNKEVRVGVATDVTLPVLKDSESYITVSYELPEKGKAPIQRGDFAGEMNVYENGSFVYATPLYYFEDID